MGLGIPKITYEKVYFFTKNQDACAIEQENIIQDKNNGHMVKTIRQQSDRKETITKPLFPSYIFVEDHSNGEFYKALTVEGACLYISFGKEYAMVREEEIAKIKLLVGVADITDFEINTQILRKGGVKNNTPQTCKWSTRL